MALAYWPIDSCISKIDERKNRSEERKVKKRIQAVVLWLIPFSCWVFNLTQTVQVAVYLLWWVLKQLKLCPLSIVAQRRQLRCWDELWVFPLNFMHSPVQVYHRYTELYWVTDTNRLYWLWINLFLLSVYMHPRLTRWSMRHHIKSVLGTIRLRIPFETELTCYYQGL